MALESASCGSETMNIELTFPYLHAYEEVAAAVAQRCGGAVPFRILKRSIDARQHRSIRVQYSISTDCSDPAEEIREAVRRQATRLLASGATQQFRPVVVGSGPGGIFCADWLLLHGFKPMLLEQGPDMRRRVRDMARFMKHGELHPYSNICFGAGGAGTYSDGKLITRIRSPYIPFIMRRFVEFGAPEDIRYVYNPHLGSNKIRQCITRLLDDLAQRGVSLRYETRVTGLSSTGNADAIAVGTDVDAAPLEAHAVFLATGHSARDVYRFLRERDVSMELKDFAIGVRVEHPAESICAMQYGAAYKQHYPGIETAQYKLARTWKDEDRAVYSFCMCPGGYVLNASSSTDGVVTNGMSNYLKSGRFSNAAIVVNVSARDLEREGYGGLDGGVRFQADLESAFRASVNPAGSCATIPGQRLTDFLAGRESVTLSPSSCVNPVAPAAIHRLLPEYIRASLVRGFEAFDRKMAGFARHADAQIFGVESRTSSPYRISRDATSLRSPALGGLYPVGEGAGYAGGITSAAVDGIRAAQAWITTFIEADERFQQKSRSALDPGAEEA